MSIRLFLFALLWLISTLYASINPSESYSLLRIYLIHLQAIEVQHEHEGGFPEQALKYLSEAEDTLKSTDETYTFVDESMYEDEDEESFVGDDGVPSISAKTSKRKRPTPVPTKRPPPKPTNSAKSSKTKNPTPRPTKRPTPRPTKSAKSSKTKNPTPRPTKRPTPRPTKSAKSSKTKNPTPRPTKNPTPRPTKNPTPRPTKSAKSSKTKNPTPRPTKNPTPRPTKRPTPRPTKRPTVSRHQANKLIARKWKDDECAMSCRFQSERCLDLDEGVCSMTERRIISRFSKKAVKVCNKVGLPPRTKYYDNMYGLVESLESGSMPEDEDYDYDVYAATTSPKSSKRGSYDYDVYAASISTKSSKSDTSTSSKGSKSSNLAFD